jgi:hypothetical protein
LQESHSLKLHFVRKLRDVLVHMGVSVDRCVHIGMREKDWEKLQFQRVKSGTGRQIQNEDPEFVIDVYRSPPFSKVLVAFSEVLSWKAECNIPSSMLLFKENMWKLRGKKKRVAEKS